MAARCATRGRRWWRCGRFVSSRCGFPPYSTQRLTAASPYSNADLRRGEAGVGRGARQAAPAHGERAVYPGGAADADAAAGCGGGGGRTARGPQPAACAPRHAQRRHGGARRGIRAGTPFAATFRRGQQQPRQRVSPPAGNSLPEFAVTLPGVCRCWGSRARWRRWRSGVTC
jgi:hypothetical protein